MGPGTRADKARSSITRCAPCKRRRRKLAYELSTRLAYLQDLFEPSDIKPPLSATQELCST
jgi:hypothetical protein